MNKQLKQGFTLVEIMIVVAIIGILAAIAVPNFIRSRQTSQKNACIANLKQIEAAKEQCIINGEDITVDNVNKYMRQALTTLSCPSKKNAKFTASNLGTSTTPPTCPAGVTNHKLEDYVDTGDTNDNASF